MRLSRAAPVAPVRPSRAARFVARRKPLATCASTGHLAAHLTSLRPYCLAENNGACRAGIPSLAGFPVEPSMTILFLSAASHPFEAIQPLAAQQQSRLLSSSPLQHLQPTSPRFSRKAHPWWHSLESRPICASHDGSAPVGPSSSSRVLGPQIAPLLRLLLCNPLCFWEGSAAQRKARPALGAAAPHRGTGGGGELAAPSRAGRLTHSLTLSLTQSNNTSKTHHSTNTQPASQARRAWARRPRGGEPRTSRAERACRQCKPAVCGRSAQRASQSRQ